MAKSLRERLRLDCLAQAVRKGVRVRTDRGFPRGSWIVRVYVGNGAGYIYGATLWAVATATSTVRGSGRPVSPATRGASPTSATEGGTSGA